VSAIYLDTSGWFASLTPDDPGHGAARARLEASARDGARLVTTSLVVAEMHAMLLRRKHAAYALDFVDRAFDSGSYQVLFPNDEIVAVARANWLRRFADQGFSLCDAVSFEVMRRERITSALATDRHFAVAGFEILR
jgi:predicted nucleic acid-binding protein